MRLAFATMRRYRPLWAQVVYVVLTAAIWAIVLWLAFIGFAKLFAAPVPPPPPLTESILIGEWRLSLGPDLTNIRLVLSADGTYTEQYTDPGAVLSGRWWMHRGWVVLEAAGGSQVTFTMDPRTFQGRTPNQWVVKLSKPVRP